MSLFEIYFAKSICTTTSPGYHVLSCLKNRQRAEKRRRKNKKKKKTENLPIEIAIEGDVSAKAKIIQH